MAGYATAAARRAEKEITSGTYRGALHGIPVAVKDLCFTKGVRTTGGTRALADHVGQRFTVPFDYNGAPTLTVPCGMNGEGLPLSLQFAGRPLSEPLLCQIGHAYEQATEWHKLHPPNEDGVGTA